MSLFKEISQRIIDELTYKADDIEEKSKNTTVKLLRNLKVDLSKDGANFLLETIFNEAAREQLAIDMAGAFERYNEKMSSSGKSQSDIKEEFIKKTSDRCCQILQPFMNYLIESHIEPQADSLDLYLYTNPTITGYRTCKYLISVKSVAMIICLIAAFAVLTYFYYKHNPVEIIVIDILALVFGALAVCYCCPQPSNAWYNKVTKDEYQSFSASNRQYALERLQNYPDKIKRSKVGGIDEDTELTVAREVLNMPGIVNAFYNIEPELSLDIITLTFGFLFPQELHGLYIFWLQNMAPGKVQTENENYDGIGLNNNEDKIENESKYENHDEIGLDNKEDKIEEEPEEEYPALELAVVKSNNNKSSDQDKDNRVEITIDVAKG